MTHDIAEITLVGFGLLVYLYILARLICRAWFRSADEHEHNNRKGRGD